MRVSVVYSGDPFRVTARSLEVPPMSRDTIRGSPAVSDTCAAATTPDAGPESSVSTGRRRAVAMLTVPPFDVAMWTGARIPIPASRAARSA